MGISFIVIVHVPGTRQQKNKAKEPEVSARIIF